MLRFAPYQGKRPSDAYGLTGAVFGIKKKKAFPYPPVTTAWSVQRPKPFWRSVTRPPLGCTAATLARAVRRLRDDVYAAGHVPPLRSRVNNGSTGVRLPFRPVVCPVSNPAVCLFFVYRWPSDRN